MDIQRKVARAKEAIQSISTHRDHDVVVLKAALANVAKFVADESAALDQLVLEEAKAVIAPETPDPDMPEIKGVLRINLEQLQGLSDNSQ